MQFIQAYFREAPNRTTKFDYGARTDGQPEYIGHAIKGTATSSIGWVIFKYTYASSSNDANVTQIDSSGGAWDLRTEYWA